MSDTRYFALNILHISFWVGVCFWTKCTIGSPYFLTFLKHLKEQQIFEKVVCFEFSGILELPKSQAAALRIRTLLNWLELRILIYRNYTQSKFICPIKIIWKRSNKMNSDCKEIIVHLGYHLSSLGDSLSEGCCLFPAPHSIPHPTPTSFISPLHCLLCGMRH